MRQRTAPPKVSERLMAKLRTELPELEIPDGARLERAAGSYAGWNRSSLGAWVWTVVMADGAPLCRSSEGVPQAIGSQWTMTELLRLGVTASSPNGYGDIDIDPPDEMQRPARTPRQ